MADTRDRLAEHMRLLLAALGDAAGCAGLDERQWDLLVRSARTARLLGVLAARISAAGVVPALPQTVANHLQAATAEAEYLRQMILRQLAVVAETLRPLGVPLLALKGAAYIIAGRHCSAGRLPRDVDIMVPRDRLDDVERTLLAAGWTFQKTDPYDQHYYRAWSHELPPMLAPTLPLELDVHHAILPPLGRLKPDVTLLWADARPTSTAPWKTLSTIDQILHAAAHVFQDSDCIGRLRDLVDFDGLCRQALVDDARFPAAIGTRAESLGLARPLWYALDAARDWLRLPIDLTATGLRPPPWPGRTMTASFARRCLADVHPDAEPAAADRLARHAMAARALWLRMPPHLLAYHAVSKAVRSFHRPAPAPAEP